MFIAGKKKVDGIFTRLTFQYMFKGDLHKKQMTSRKHYKI